MNIKSIQSYNSTQSNQLKSDLAVNTSNSKAKSCEPNFGIGMRGALIESISEGEKILKLEKNSPELVDMAERFHTCPEKIIKRVSYVYEYSGLSALLGMKSINEVKSETAYTKLSNAISNVKRKKACMSGSKLQELNNKAHECFEEYKKYLNI